MSVKGKLIKRAKARAKKKGMEFSLTVDDLTLPLYCPILGIRLQVNQGALGGRYNSPTLDRKDNSKGYTVDNVWVISQLANQMKSNATPAQLLAFSIWIDGEYSNGPNFKLDNPEV